MDTRTFQQLQSNQKWDKDTETKINQLFRYASGLAASVSAYSTAAIAAAVAQHNSISSAHTNAFALHTSSAYHDAKPTFLAHKNSVDQTSISAASTPLTFSTERWDTGGFFASNGWTPPAGKHHIKASVRFDLTNAVDNEALSLDILEDGSTLFRTTVSRAGTGTPPSVAVDGIVNATGANTYTVAAFKGGAGVGTIQGSAALTYFCGAAI